MRVKIDCFTTLAKAESFFKKATRPEPGETTDWLDGFILKEPGNWSYYLDHSWKSDLNPSEKSYLVITYPKGTAFAIDSGIATDNSEDAE